MFENMKRLLQTGAYTWRIFLLLLLYHIHRKKISVKSKLIYLTNAFIVSYIRNNL